MKVLNLNGYIIEVSNSKEATHCVTGVHDVGGENPLKSLTEKICIPMCTEHDSGERHSPSSAHTYTTKTVSDHKGIHLKALACVQRTIWKHYNDQIRWIKIRNTNQKSLGI